MRDGRKCKNPEAFDASRFRWRLVIYLDWVLVLEQEIKHLQAGLMEHLGGEFCKTL